MSTNNAAEIPSPAEALDAGEALDALIAAMRQAMLDELKQRDLGLTLPELQALRLLCHEPGISLRCIVRATSRDKAQVTRKIKALEAKGLVRRERDPQDHRAFCLYLTDKGRAVEAAYRAARASLDERLLSALSAREAGQLTALLNKCLAAFPRADGDTLCPRD